MTIALIFLAGLAASSPAGADDHLRGVIAGRGDDGSVIVQTDDLRTVSVIMLDSTKIRRTLSTTTVRMSSASLTPGLRVRVHGRYEGEDRFFAKRITFSTTDFMIARDIAVALENNDKAVGTSGVRRR